jgi:predicted PurR-regulated permease PerM
MPGRNPWGWVTDERVTLALKVLMILVLAAYLGHFLIGFFARIRGIIYILIGAVFFAYLIYPAVHWLTRWMHRIYAILIVYAGILAVLAVAGTFLLPRIVSDIGQIVAQTPATVASLNAMLNNPSDPVMSKFPPWMRAELVKIPDQAILWIKVHGVETVGKAMVLLMGTFVAIATFVIIPLITAYLLLDLDNLKNGLSAVIPPKRWRATLDFLHDVDHVIGGFIRGQLLVALAVGILITIALLILRVPYAFLLGLLAAIGDLIPYVGAILAFVPAISTALFVNGWVNALIVLIVFVGIFEIEGHVIAPNIVGHQVSLSPFIVLLALLIGADLGGLVGMLVAVPIAGVLRVIAVRVFSPPPTNGGGP